MGNIGVRRRSRRQSARRRRRRQSAAAGQTHNDKFATSCVEQRGGHAGVRARKTGTEATTITRVWCVYINECGGGGHTRFARNEAARETGKENAPLKMGNIGVRRRSRRQSAAANIVKTGKIIHFKATTCIGTVTFTNDTYKFHLHQKRDGLVFNLRRESRLFTVCSFVRMCITHLLLLA